MSDATGERPESGPHADDAHPSGLTVAALAIAVFTVVGGLAAWLAWLTLGVRSAGGWFAYTPLHQSAPFLPVPSAMGLGPMAALAAAGTWFAMLPTAGVGLVLADAARRRATSPDQTAGVRLAVVIAVGSLVVAIAGIAALFLSTHGVGSYRTGG